MGEVVAATEAAAIDADSAGMSLSLWPAGF
jgi:hypothetical protein